MTKKPDNGVHVIDKTKGDPVSAVKAAIDNLDENQKQELLKEMGATNGPRRNKNKELFEEAKTRLYNEMPNIKAILEGVEIPCAFTLSIGFDDAGNFCANFKRARKPYGKRKEKD
jgi:hypothetical protein